VLVVSTFRDLEDKSGFIISTIISHENKVSNFTREVSLVTALSNKYFIVIRVSVVNIEEFFAYWFFSLDVCKEESFL